MEREIKIGNIYKHFKGHIYRVIELAYDSENYNEENPEESKMVVYQNVEDKSKCWVRPYQMFNSLVDKEKYPNVEQKYRFEDITKEYRMSIEDKVIDKNSAISLEGLENLSEVELGCLSDFDPMLRFEEEWDQLPSPGLPDDYKNCHESKFSINATSKVKERK